MDEYHKYLWEKKQVAKEQREYDFIYINSKFNYILFRITYICSRTIKKNKRQWEDKYKIQDSVYILERRNGTKERETRGDLTIFCSVF